MHLDKYGLPVQADGDANDQLQRCAMIDMAKAFGHYPWSAPIETGFALAHRLQPRRGIYTRYTGGNTNNVSGDQLISALCAWIARRDFKQASWLCLRVLMRGGFAQNTRDMYSREKWKVPDFILIRALPLMMRVHWTLYPLAVIADLLLVLSALTQAMPVWKDDTGFAKRSPDDVDDNLSVMTFIVCRAVMQTPLSFIAAKLYAYVRPWNLGCEEGGDVYAHHPVIGALRWYHRAESGGNPEIAYIYNALVTKWIK